MQLSTDRKLRGIRKELPMVFRKHFALIVALALVFILAACNKAPAPTTTAAPTEPPITAEYLYAKLGENAATTPITGGEIEGETDIIFTFAALGTSITCSIGETGTFSYSPDQDIRYLEGLEGMSVYGKTTFEDIIRYAIKEDGELVTYIYNKTNDTWSRQASGQLMWNICSAALTPDSLTLEETTQTVANKEVYVLHAQFSGEALKDSIGNIEDLLESMDMAPDSVELDMSSISVPTTYYIDAESLLLVQMEVTREGIGEAITDILVEYMLSSLEEVKDELGEEYASTVKIYKHLKVTSPLDKSTYKNLSYDPVTVPELPAEAKEAAALMEYDPLQADGSYVLKQIGATATIVPPTDWTVAEKDHHMVIAIAPDEINKLHYWLMDDVSEQDVLDGFETSADTYKEYNAYMSHKLGDVVDGWQTATITRDAQTHVYLAWKQVSDHNWIWVEYHDFRNASMSDTLLPQLKSVSVGK